MSRQEEEWKEPLWKYSPDTRTWQWKDMPFKSSISLGQTTLTSPFVYVPLQATVNSNLAWKPEIDPQTLGVLWWLDLAILPMKTSITEESTFQALKFNLEQFSNKIFKTYSDRTLGVVLHHSTLDFKGFYWDMQQLEQFIGWLDDCQDIERQEMADVIRDYFKRSDVSGFCQAFGMHVSTQQYILHLLSQYWHYLASSLDEDCPVFVNLDAMDQSLNNQLQLVAQPIWQHIHIIAKNFHPSLGDLQEVNGSISPMEGDIDTTLGLVVCDTKYLGPSIAKKIANLMDQLDRHCIRYRLIQESTLTQHWSGLNDLIVFPESLSPAGLRMLRGFQASGGYVRPVGIRLGDSLWSPAPPALCDNLLC